MKKLIYCGMGLFLCLFAAVWTGCDKPNSGDDDSLWEKGLQILNAEGDGITDLDLRQTLSFILKNSGNISVAWDIPDFPEKWIDFNKRSGELAPGDIEQIELIVDWEKMSDGENAATVVISSPFGDNLLTVLAEMSFSVGSDYEETAFGMVLKMVAVEGGTFMMGATVEQCDSISYFESPVHKVTLDGFYIGAFEVTQAQWEAVMGMNPSRFKGADLPVDGISWDHATEFCEKLSQMTGRKYRLPTEAEWEYAARGGQSADGTKYAGSNNLDEVAWCEGNSGETPHPVCTKQPNGLGLYDMSGNVWEWCSDWWDYYSETPSVNPRGPSYGSNRVIRGGSWYNDSQDCRVSSRFLEAPDRANIYILGFRVVCEAK